MIVEYILCLGVGLIVASVTVYLRDLQYILGIIVMALQYLTPVMYGVDVVENAHVGKWLITMFNLNPMTSIIRYTGRFFIIKVVPELSDLLLSLVMGIVFIVIGELLLQSFKRICRRILTDICI